jgi:hypothetical protein
MRSGIRVLERAKARLTAGIIPGPTAVQGLANTDSIVVAIEAVASTRVSLIEAIPARPLESTAQRAIACRLRRTQYLADGRGYTPCCADFVTPRTVPRSSRDRQAKLIARQQAAERLGLNGAAAAASSARVSLGFRKRPI